ncbi:MAG: type VI secretion system-associated protein TagO [Deltaproteobacteria bacterium]|jgi:predicted Zn finger-like uncharacterized protein|nr:type VI secretion system-associated protein TagO [Deltaproteobacteria bacterium]
MMRAKCPNCQAAYSIKPEFIGKQTVCQNCGQIFTIYEDRPELSLSPTQPVEPGPPPPAQSPPSPPPRPPEPPVEPPQPPQKAPEPPKPAPEHPAPKAGGRGHKVALALLALLTLLVLALGAGGYYLYQLYEKSQADLVAAQAQASRLSNPRLREIQEDRQKIAEQIKEQSAEQTKFSEGSALWLLKNALISELRLSDTLLSQEKSSLVSGAPVTIKVNKSNPDPALAKQLEAQLEKVTEYINQRTEATKDLKGPEAEYAAIELAELHLNKAIVIRNYLTAKYGLSSFLVSPASRAPQPAEAGVTPPANPTSPAPPQPSGPTAQKPPPPWRLHTVRDILSPSSGWKINGSWAINESGSGESKVIHLMRLASVVHAEISGEPQQASLFISCQKDKTDLLVSFALPLAVDGNKVEMQYQIDNEEPVRETWLATPAQSGAIAAKPIPMLRKMAQAKVINFKVGYERRPDIMETSFQLDGLNEAIKPIQTGCNWK